MEAAVRYDNVSKRYLLGSRRAYINYLLPDFFRRRKEKNINQKEVLWALKDISLEVQPGEVLGFIGPNGAGKTTALSLLAGIISPTTGKISVRGRIGALIKLGAGFHPDLTGRENVYLNGSIMGLRRAEINKLYDDIVEFAELGTFMDTPVKRYSSGMYVRLGFAVAVHIDPEILLVDEILSVGDVSFQARCLNRIGEIREAGTTVVFVSHNLHNVASFCDRVVYLKNGQIQCIGEPGEVLGAYTTDMMSNQISKTEIDGSDMDVVNGSGRMIITAVSFLDEAGNQVHQIKNGDPVIVRIHYQAAEPIDNPLLDVVIRDAARGNMFQATNRDFGIEFGQVKGSGFLDVHFKRIPANNQVLNFFFTLWNSNHTERLDWKRFLKLQVAGNPMSSGRALFECDWHLVADEETVVVEAVEAEQVI